MKIMKLTAFLAIVIAMVSGCANVNPFAKKEEDKAPVTLEVVEKDIEQKVFLSGEITTDATRNISALAGGKVKKVHVSLGDRVNKGQVLAELDDESLQQSLKAKQINLAIEKERLNSLYSQGDESLVLAVEVAEREVVKAKEAMEKQSKLFEQGAISQVELDGYTSALQAAKDNLTNAKVGLKASTRATDIAIQLKTIEAMTLDVAMVEKELEDLKLISSIEGTVVEVHAKEGEMITAETYLFKVMDLNQCYIKTHVSEAEISKIAIDQEVAVTGVAIRGKYVKGRVSDIAPGTKRIEGKKQSYVEVKINMEEQEPALRPDFAVELEVLVNSKENATAVKFEAIQTDVDGSPYVMVYRDGEEIKQIIDVGIEGEIYTEIISESVVAGDMLLMGSEYLEEAPSEGLFDI